MFLLIDNYDSFTYNLVQAFCRLGHRPRVVRNDDPGLVAMANDPSLRMVCISPGPGHPSRAGYCLEAWITTSERTVFTMEVKAEILNFPEQINFF